MKKLNCILGINTKLLITFHSQTDDWNKLEVETISLNIYQLLTRLSKPKTKPQNKIWIKKEKKVWESRKVHNKNKGGTGEDKSSVTKDTE